MKRGGPERAALQENPPAACRGQRGGCEVLVASSGRGRAGAGVLQLTRSKTSS
jgi:hypothetical protein